MDRSKQALFGAWRIAFTLLVTYGFTIILMTAAVQQQVSAELARTRPELDYSSAYREYQALGQNQDLIKKLVSEEAEQAGEAERLARAAEDAAATADDAWRDFRGVSPVGKLEAACTAPADSDPPAVWAWTRRCMADAELSAAERRRLNEALETRPTALELYRASLASRRAADRAGAAVKETRDRLAAARESAAAGAALADAFDDTNGLGAKWLPAGQTFVAFSPFLMQILLALGAGAFGAMLLTLILAVYPKSDLRFTSGQGFEARILLGGLISVCVYVVLSGGASIIGGAGSLAEGSTNVMTFCAVGVLAGMFSDRAAFWLSDRADVFFSGKKPGEEDPDARDGDAGPGGGEDGGAAAPASPAPRPTEP